MTTPITVHNLFDDSFIGTRQELIFGDIEFSYPEGKEQRRHVFEIHLEDQDGYPLFSSPINPGVDLGSKFARKGLPGSFLLECPRLEDVEPAINRLVDGKHLIFWGAKTDRSMFPSNLNTARSVICAMERFAPLAGEYSITHGNYTWPTLQNALELTGIEPPEGIVHRAATDTAALRLIWQWMEQTSIPELLRAASSRDNDFF